RVARLVSVRSGVDCGDDLRAVALLTAREARLVAENAYRRPVAALGESHIRRDPVVSGAAARPGVAEPDSFPADEVEGEEAHRPIGKARHESLGTSPHHVPAAYHSIHAKDAGWLPVLPHLELVAPLSYRRYDYRIREADRPPIEIGDRALGRGRTTGATVCRPAPGTVLRSVTRCTRLGADEVGEANRIVRLARAFPARRRERQ